MNGLKVVATIVVVVLIGVMAWQYMPVEVETGTAQLCQSEHHQGNQEISRDTEIMRVPRWRAGNYKIQGQNVICDSCQEKLDAEKREAERQERIAREAAEREAKAAKVRDGVMGRVGMYGYAPVVFNNYGEFHVSTNPGEYELSLTPGRFVNLTVSAVNKTNEPLDAGKFRLRIQPAGSIVFEQNQGHADLYSQWQKLIGSGLLIGELNPCTNSYYKPETWQWPPYGTGYHHTNVGDGAKPGTDIRITGYIVIDGIEIETNTAVIHVMHP